VDEQPDAIATIAATDQEQNRFITAIPFDARWGVAMYEQGARCGFKWVRRLKAVTPVRNFAFSAS
jgi:hypothetical protein